MYDKFQTWALETYGDSAKTKTVTRRKYLRILKILRGEEQTTSENSKFRFWVRAKGFTLGPPGAGTSLVKKGEYPLYVPCSRVPTNSGEEETIYKKVAVVENFFDIIYDVHVESDGKSGKHAGQKRTYRAIAETYAFLPREAVTHFLMSCANCQKRMHLASDSSPPHPGAGNGKIGSRHGNEVSCNQRSKGTSSTPGDSEEIDYSLPITTTYLKHMKSLTYDVNGTMRVDGEECSSTVDSEVSENCQYEEPTQFDTYRYDDEEQEELGYSSSQELNDSNVPLDMTNQNSLNEPINMSKQSNQDDKRLKGTPDPSEELSIATKEDEEESDEEESDKVEAHNKYDPERLKAFNLFVRLFVDENLDRVVPISRQPKDKVQAIIDSCRRQFPEFAERARKRIRTYLKSCRRTKRCRNQNGLDGIRPTPPHLTSALAEQILASACKNESLNAKRMKLGLKPLAVEVKGAKDLEHKLYNSNNNNNCRQMAVLSSENNYSLNTCPCSNGPTDLSVKKQTVNCSNYTLHPNEVFAVKQLIAGYRESAAFLFRSADELEHLLQQQN
ncbi:nucleolar protein 4-like [Centruroides vittatus]|uniref:nucleolar protein 4-like n=1 Tax=Centruroides vittatus TaxID=120091 RepID=UPI0035102D3B